MELMKSPGRWGITVVNVLPVEQYLYGVVGSQKKFQRLRRHGETDPHQKTRPSRLTENGDYEPSAIRARKENDAGKDGGVSAADQ